jgi:hypothetical protein
MQCCGDFVMLFFTCSNHCAVRWGLSIEDEIVLATSLDFGQFLIFEGDI